VFLLGFAFNLKEKKMIKNIYNKLTIIALSLITFSSSFAINKANPWGDKSLGIDLTKGDDAEKTIGDWVITGLWYIGIIVAVVLFIVGIWNIIAAMQMSREEKEHSKPMVKIIFAIVCIVIGFAISGFLFSGLSNAG
jgi:uncharacterized membrane protein YwzB